MKHQPGDSAAEMEGAEERNAEEVRSGLVSMKDPVGLPATGSA